MRRDQVHKGTVLLSQGDITASQTEVVFFLHGHQSDLCSGGNMAPDPLIELPRKALS